MTFENYYVCPLNKQIEYKRNTVRKKLLNVEHSICVISGMRNLDTLECAHIVPRNVGYDIGFPSTDEIENVMLLNRILHKLFDTYSWYLDVVHTAKQSNTKDYFDVMIVADEEDDYLSMFNGKYVKIHIRHYPSLFVHQWVCLSNNHDESEYLEAMNHPSFIKIYKYAMNGGKELKMMQQIVKYECQLQ